MLKLLLALTGRETSEKLEASKAKAMQNYNEYWLLFAEKLIQEFTAMYSGLQTSQATILAEVKSYLDEII